MAPLHATTMANSLIAVALVLLTTTVDVGVEATRWYWAGITRDGTYRVAKVVKLEPAEPYGTVTVMERTGNFYPHNGMPELVPRFVAVAWIKCGFRPQEGEPLLPAAPASRPRPQTPVRDSVYSDGEITSPHRRHYRRKTPPPRT